MIPADILTALIVLMFAILAWLCVRALVERFQRRREPEPEPEDHGDQGGRPTTWRERLEEGEGT